MDCEYESIPLQPTLSIKADKTNTLHQFDTAGIVGLQSPVGKVPIVFYIKDTCDSAHKGIIYYDDYDTVCYMFPEDKHAKWCEQPYDLKYDALEKWDNGIERGYRRKHGIFELWRAVYREWYNGRVFFRPKLKVQGCGRHLGGYPTSSATTSTVVTVEEKVPKNNRIIMNKKTKANHSCGCRKGV